MPQILEGAQAKQSSKALAKKSKLGQKLPKHVGYVGVMNTLVNKNAPFLSGATSYQGIVAETLEYAQEGKKTLLMEFDSHGGEAAGMFETIQHLTDIKKQYGLQLIGVVTGTCASAAYGLASVCDKLYATQDSTVGSIAAVMMHRDSTKQDKKSGLKYTIMRSKAHKYEGSPHEKLKRGARNRFLGVLTSLDESFNLAVTRRKSLSLATVVKLKGETVQVDEALKLGLVDKSLPYFDVSLIKEFHIMTKKEKRKILQLVNTRVEASMKPLKTSMDTINGQLTVMAKEAAKKKKFDKDLFKKKKAKGKKGKKKAKIVGKKAASTQMAIMQLGVTLKQPKLAMKLANKQTKFSSAKTQLMSAYKAETGKKAIFQEDGALSTLKASEDDSGAIDLADV